MSNVTADTVPPLALAASAGDRAARYREVTATIRALLDG